VTKMKTIKRSEPGICYSRPFAFASPSSPSSVIPAKAGIQYLLRWTPAFAGVTKKRAGVTKERAEATKKRAEVTKKRAGVTKERAEATKERAGFQPL
ncbi:MAG: hypothetical protein WCF85_00690, partial [Rhodospirillaceae bacterium]